MRFFPILASMALAVVTTGAASAADYYNAQAGPNIWGEPIAVCAHLGPAPYTITYHALGNTSVIGEVTYYDPNGCQVTREFNGVISFRTGNVVASPKVRFKGTPFSCGVKVTVSP